MGKRVQFNPADVFLSGACSESEQIALRGSCLWSTVVAMYSACEKGIRVSKFAREPSGNSMSAFISNRYGIHVARVSTDGSEHTVEVVRDPISDVMPDRSWGMYSCLARSRNQRYLTTVFRKGSTHDAKAGITHALYKADHTLNDFCVNMLDRVSVAINDRNRPSVIKFDMSYDIQKEMAKALVEGRGLSSLPMDVQNKFNTEYAKYNQQVDKFMGVMDKVSEFYNADKWVYVPMGQFGMILASVTSYAFNAAIDEFRRSLSTNKADYTTNFFDFDLAGAPRWYKSYEDVPESIRSEFELSCLMMRTHAGGYDGILPPLDINVGDDNTLLWLPIGSGVRKYYSEYPIYLINK